MSHVRMCDFCSTVFPEGIEGSAVAQGSRTVRDEYSGRKTQEQVTLDQCPRCAAGQESKFRAATGGVAIGPAPTKAEAQ